MRIGVIGAGGWGTALAALLADAGHAVCLWVRKPELCAELQKTGENTRYLPGIRLPAGLTYSASLAEAAVEKELLVLAVPSQGMRGAVSELVPFVASKVNDDKVDDDDQSTRRAHRPLWDQLSKKSSSFTFPSSAAPVLVSTSKGVEEETLLTMSGVLQEVLGHGVQTRLAVLSGPSFAVDVVRGLPTAVTVAAATQALAQEVQQVFATAQFRVYTTTDVTGVEIGGAAKNVIALAAGVSDGLGYGQSARAALITRGLVEITRLAEWMGGLPQTLSGLSGLGDLVLTCTSTLSRNYRVGVRLGKDEPIRDILNSMTTVAEGVRTTRSIFALAQRYGVEMPIIEQIYALLYHHKSAREVVAALLAREVKPEFGSRN
jgi:glycerol-3-phosphate dehydrogenase (NAD(P)+)